jgi:protein-tyrosine phosphatase
MSGLAVIELPSANSALPVEGVYNLREIGGYLAAGGRITRTGVLYRSDGLHGLTSRGRQAFAELGLRQVIDLRSAEELAKNPNVIDGLGLEVQLSTLAESHSLNRLTDKHECLTASPQSWLPLFDSAGTSAQAMSDTGLEGIYRQLVNEAGRRFAQVVRLLASGPAPVLVHCTAGKDRTGVVVAITLDAVGVERAAIVADYAASEANLSGTWFENTMARFDGLELLAAELTPAWLASPPALITALLDQLDQEYGGSAGYLRANGLTEAELAALAHRLTEPMNTND